MNTTNLIVGTAAALAGLSALVGGVMAVARPLKRLADQMEVVVQIVLGVPAKIENGYVIEQRRPGVVEMFQRQGHQLNQQGQQLNGLQQDVRGLYGRVDAFERRLTGPRHSTEDVLAPYRV